MASLTLSKPRLSLVFLITGDSPSFPGLQGSRIERILTLDWEVPGGRMTDRC